MYQGKMRSKDKTDSLKFGGMVDRQSGDQVVYVGPLRGQTWIPHFNINRTVEVQKYGKMSRSDRPSIMLWRSITTLTRSTSRRWFCVVDFR